MYTQYTLRHPYLLTMFIDKLAVRTSNRSQKQPREKSDEYSATTQSGENFV